jgi:hypothetical protein
MVDHVRVVLWVHLQGGRQVRQTGFHVLGEYATAGHNTGTGAKQLFQSLSEGETLR